MRFVTLHKITPGKPFISHKNEVLSMESTFFPRFEALCREAKTSPNAVAKELGISSGSVTAWKKGAAPRSATLERIADYFAVSCDYLLGKEEAAPTESGRRGVSDADIKFALFGGDGDITDEMFDEVKRFAQFVKHRQADQKQK